VSTALPTTTHAHITLKKQPAVRLGSLEQRQRQSRGSWLARDQKQKQKRKQKLQRHVHLSSTHRRAKTVRFEDVVVTGREMTVLFQG